MSLVSNILNTSSYKPKEKKKSGLKRFADTISAPFEAVNKAIGIDSTVETLAKPFVEAYAGVQELRGKETSRWVKEHGLQTPETAALMTKGATDNSLGALVKKKKAEGYKGAGATDILNVASLAPGLGTFAKGSKALGSASKVASGAERLLPTLGRTLKGTVPAGAAWGSAYGAAGAYDQGGDIGEGALVGGLTGAAIGGGLGVAGASIGSLANKASRLVNKDLRVKGIVDLNLRGLTQLEDNNAVVRKAIGKYKQRGVDAKKLLAQTDLLVGAVDDTGTLRTTQEGGAVSQLQDFIKPQESVVSDILKREGKIVSLKDVEKNMIKNLDASNITGADLIAAQNKIKQEIAGLRRRADKEGNVPMWLVQDAKTYKYGNIDYMKPSSKNTDKLIARTYKEMIEKGTDSADIEALNKELQAHYSVLGLLERLDGKKVQGGKLGKYFAQTVGSIVGSHFGPLGSIVGAEIGGRIRGAQLQSQFGKAAGKGMERSQTLLDAMDLAQKPKPAPELIPESRRLAAPAIVTPPPADTSRLFTQEEARAYLGESAQPKNRSMLQLGAPAIKTPTKDTSGLLSQEAAQARLKSYGEAKAVPKQRLGLPAPAMTTPVQDASGLLSQEEARAKLRSYGVSVDDLAPQSSKSLGSLNTSQSKTITPTSIGISKSVAEKPKLDINSVESLDSEITRRLEKFRSDAGLMADKKGAGVRLYTPDNGLDTADTRTFKTFSLNKAKGDMKYQAESFKKYAHTLLYENDPEFRSLVDMKDALLETKIVEAKTIPEVEEVFRMADTEEKVILNEVKQYESSAIDETPSTPKENQGNGLGQEKGAATIEPIDSGVYSGNIHDLRDLNFMDRTSTGWKVKSFRDGQRLVNKYTGEYKDFAFSNPSSGGETARDTANIHAWAIDNSLEAPKVGNADSFNVKESPLLGKKSPKALKAVNKKQFDDAMMKDVSDFYKAKSPDSPLLSEAKKYKTAEEFVEAQKQIFHGTNKENAKMIEKSFKILSEEEHNKFPTTVVGDTQLGLSTTTDRAYADYFNSLQPSGKGKTVELYLSPDSKIYELPKSADSIDSLGIERLRELIAEGYDAIHDVDNIGGENELRILSARNVKTKSQLLDIYKKAHGDKLGKLQKK